MSVIREICDYVYVLDKGRIVENGSIEQVFYNSRHPVTKSLIQSTFSTEVPNALKTRLVDSAENCKEVMIRLIFSNNNVQKPFISELIIKFCIKINIISGHYDHCRNLALGNLLVTFKYDQHL